MLRGGVIGRQRVGVENAETRVGRSWTGLLFRGPNLDVSVLHVELQLGQRLRPVQMNLEHQVLAVRRRGVLAGQTKVNVLRGDGLLV